MYLVETDSNWEVRAPAKLNLLLEVLRRRSDGFHNVETFMMPVGLFDTLFFRSRPTGAVELACRFLGGASRAPLFRDVPLDDSNLVVRAASLLRERAGMSAGAAIQLVKRIPSGAGLGGGSSDAAAALVVANRAWGLGWSVDQLRTLAAELGSDVPFFLGRSGGSASGAVCRGRGEKVETANSLGTLHFVIVCPPRGLSTKQVFAACRPASDREAAESRQRLRRLIRALERGRLAAAARLMYNRLQHAAAKLSDWVDRLQGEFSRLDCLGHLMTGSGSGYFGICGSARHARRVAAQLRLRDVGYVCAVSTCRLGLPVI